MKNEEWVVVDTYTRKEAIADGSLIEINEIATEAGFKHPIAITAALHNLVKAAIQDGSDTEDWILWDILTMLKHNIMHQDSSDKIWFEFSLKNKIVKLWSVCDGGDDDKPVITIMLTTED